MATKRGFTQECEGSSVGASSPSLLKTHARIPIQVAIHTKQCYNMRTSHNAAGLWRWCLLQGWGFWSSKSQILCVMVTWCRVWWDCHQEMIHQPEPNFYVCMMTCKLWIKIGWCRMSLCSQNWGWPKNSCSICNNTCSNNGRCKFWLFRIFEFQWGVSLEFKDSNESKFPMRSIRQIYNPRSYYWFMNTLLKIVRSLLS